MIQWIKLRWKVAILAFRVWQLKQAAQRGIANMDMVTGVIRALLAAAGGYAVSKGFADQTTVDSMIGALMILATGAWSVWAKVKAKPA